MSRVDVNSSSKFKIRCFSTQESILEEKGLPLFRCRPSSRNHCTISSMAIIKEVLDSFSMQSFNSIAKSLPKFFQGTWRSAVVGTFLLLVSIVTFRVAVDHIEHNRILADTLSWRRESLTIDHGSDHDPKSTVDSSIRIPIFQRQPRPKFDLPVRTYLESLEATTAAVLWKGGVQQGPKTLEEMAEERLWHKNNPCRAQTQLLSRFKSRRSTPYIETPPELAAVLEAYGRFHRACIKTSGNLTELFMSGVNRTDEGAMPAGDTECKFVIAQFGNELGDQLMTLASIFLYAVVTQRVILVDYHSYIPDLLCEPFSGSFWTTPSEFPLVHRRENLWQTHSEHHAELDKDPNGTVKVNAVRLDDSWGPVPRFYCPTEQASYSNVRWVTVAGCLYFLPKLFVIPTFAALLSSIFKDPGASSPLTHILRTTLVPSDIVWAQVLRANHVYLQGATRQVGVHTQYLGNGEDFRDNHELIISNVEECLLSNELLPVNANGNYAPGSPRRKKYWPMRLRVKHTVLFISSLYTSLFDTMAERYPQLITNKRLVNSVVELVQLSHEGHSELSTLATDRRALVDLICLSLSDVLLTSRMSTFSQIAQAWGGLQPWIINNRPAPDPNKTEDRHAPCTRGSAMGGCFQNGGTELSCPHDQNLNSTFPNGNPSSSARFIRACEDGSGGVEFLPSD